MAATPSQAPTRAPGQHLLLFDGVCGLCSHFVQFVLHRDRRRVFDFAPLQSEAGRSAGIDPDELTTFYVLTDYATGRGRAITKGRAALFVFAALGWPWKALAAAGVLPTRWLDGLYDLVARRRYRIFGRFDQCMLPAPADRHRFIDRL